MGKISNLENRFEQARESLNRSIALTEKDKENKELLQSAFMEMGNSYHHEGSHVRALKSYQQGLDQGYGPLQSDYSETRFRQALSYLEVGEDPEGERILNEISEEADPMLQQKIQIKLGVLGLEKQLKRLPIWKESGVGTI